MLRISLKLTSSGLIIAGLILQKKVNARSTVNFYQANLDQKKIIKERSINDVLVDCDALFDLGEIDYLVDKLRTLCEKWPTSGNFEFSKTKTKNF